MDVWVVLHKWPTSDNDWGVKAVCESKERAEQEVCEGHVLQTGGENLELHNHPRLEKESEYENGGDWLMLKKRQVKAMNELAAQLA